MKEASSKTFDSSRYHIPNLVRALKVMEVLAEHPEGLTISQITQLLQVPRNSVFRITMTLLDHGYLTRDEETRICQISQKLLAVGYSAMREQTLVEKALGAMRQLRDRFKETVPLGILHGSEGVVIEEVPGTHAFRFVLDPGKTFHLHTAAPGKAILAFLPGEEREHLIGQIEFTRFNDRTIVEPAEFRKVLVEVRNKGFAVDHAEEIEGMHCIGAPVFNRKGYPVAAIWITGPSSRIRESDFDRIGRVVRKTAEEVTSRLGYGLTGNSVEN
jgi:DNA-binding IclR family transcriptional regulator